MPHAKACSYVHEFPVLHGRLRCIWWDSLARADSPPGRGSHGTDDHGFHPVTSHGMSWSRNLPQGLAKRPHFGILVISNLGCRHFGNTQRMHKPVFGFGSSWPQRRLRFVGLKKWTLRMEQILGICRFVANTYLALVQQFMTNAHFGGDRLHSDVMMRSQIRTKEKRQEAFGWSGTSWCYLVADLYCMIDAFVAKFYLILKSFEVSVPLEKLKRQAGLLGLQALHETFQGCQLMCQRACCFVQLSAEVFVHYNRNL